VHSAERGRALRRRLAREGILTAPSVPDPFAARLAQRAGFEAVFAGGYGIAAARRALPDHGFIGLTDIVDQTARICEAVPLFVLADGDTGYGDERHVRHTLRSHAGAGASAVMIEDQAWPKRCGHMPGKSVVGRQEALERIRAAVAAREALALDILVLARTDARTVLGFEEAMWRMAAFEDCGADILFLESPLDESELARFAGGFARPCMANMLHGGVTPLLPPARLEAMGFSIVAYATAVLGAAARAMARALQAIGRGEEPGDLMGHDELQAILERHDADH